MPRLPGFDCAFGRVFSGSKPSLRVRYTNRTARFAFQYLGNAYSWYLDVTYPGMCVWVLLVVGKENGEAFAVDEDHIFLPVRLRFFRVPLRPVQPVRLVILHVQRRLPWDVTLGAGVRPVSLGPAESRVVRPWEPTLQPCLLEEALAGLFLGVCQVFFVEPLLHELIVLCFRGAALTTLPVFVLVRVTAHEPPDTRNGAAHDLGDLVVPRWRLVFDLSCPTVPLIACPCGGTAGRPPATR